MKNARWVAEGGPSGRRRGGGPGSGTNGFDDARRAPALACAARLVAFCAWAALLCGCGYRAGALIPPDVRTVHVEMFDNETFRHEIEIPLSRAVKDEIVRRTGLRILPRDAADTVLGGAILRVDAPMTAYDQADEISVQRVAVYIRFEWRRRATGEVIAKADTLSETVRMLAARGETQATASEEAFIGLAEAIVEMMQEDF